MKNNYLLFYLSLFIFSFSKIDAADNSNFEQYIHNAGLNNVQLTRVNQLMALQGPFIKHARNALQEYIECATGMCANKEYAVTKDNRPVRIYTAKKNLPPHVNDNRYVQALGKRIPSKNLSKDAVAATMKLLNFDQYQVALPLDQLESIAFALYYIDRAALGQRHYDELEENPHDYEELCHIKGLLRYHRYDSEFVTLNIPGALAKWIKEAAKNKSVTALDFFEYAYSKVSKKEQDVLFTYIKNQPYMLHLMDTTIQSIATLFRYIQLNRWQQEFNRNEFKKAELAIKEFEVHCHVIEKDYNAARSYLASKKQADLLRKRLPFYDFYDTEVSSILPLKLCIMNEPVIPTIATVSTKKPLEQKKKQLNNKKNKKKKHKKVQKATVIDDKKNSNEIEQSDDHIEQNTNIDQKDNKDEDIQQNNFIETNSSTLPTSIVPTPITEEDLTTQFLKNCSPILHFDAGRFTNYWQVLQDGYHNSTYLLDLILHSDLARTMPFVNNPNHIVRYALTKITEANGYSYWGIAADTDDEYKTYHRHVKEVPDILNESTYGALGPDYDESRHAIEWPELNQKPIVITQLKPTTDTSWVTAILTHPSVINKYGILSIPAHLLLLDGGRIIAINQHYISIYDAPNNRKIDILRFKPKK